MDIVIRIIQSVMLIIVSVMLVYANYKLKKANKKYIKMLSQKHRENIIIVDTLQLMKVIDKINFCNSAITVMDYSTEAHYLCNNLAFLLENYKLAEYILTYKQFAIIRNYVFIHHDRFEKDIHAIIIGWQKAYDQKRFEGE